MLDLAYVTYARVAHDAAATSAVLRPIDDGVKAFLNDHIAKLGNLAEQRDSPAGQFLDSEAQALFRDLALGTEAEFLAAAGALTKRLIARMDRRATQGLLVALRAQGPSELVAGVLKLEVVAEHAAVLESLDSGELVLSAATNMMDKPGELKKGALTRSGLKADEVMVGDRLAHESAYFPDAFGIRIFARPSEAGRELFKVLGSVAPRLVAPVARHISAVRPGPTAQVLRDLGRLVPGLTEDVQLRIARELDGLARPVGRIDTQGRFRRIINAGEVSVSGPIAEMEEAVHLEPTDDGRWRIVIETADEPSISYKS